MTVRTRAQLNSDADTNINDNSAGDISAADVRQRIKDLADSAYIEALGQMPFPATQNPSADANTLDDYEEGTWTPVLTFATPGNLNVTYFVQSGDYTVVGRKVTVRGAILTNAFTHTTAAGFLTITGLPFSASSTGAYLEAIGSLVFSGIVKANYTDFVIEALSNTSNLIVNTSGTSQANASVVAADVPSGGSVFLRFTLTYFR